MKINLLKTFFFYLIGLFVFSGSAKAATVEELYGFTPASATVHNYTVTDGITSVLLGDFKKHLKPLPDEFGSSFKYQAALKAWKQSDGGKWARLWPYVPMFSREDSKGYIQAIDEPGQTSSTDYTEVIFPHLARTYELTTALSYLLSPASTHQNTPDPNLTSKWTTPPPWDNNQFWLDSDANQSGNWDNLGAVCDPQQFQIYSSGDLAYDSSLTTQVSQTVTIPNPQYDPNCADPATGDLSNCFVTKDVRYSPTYLKTYTPYLHQITNNLLTGPNAIFAALSPYISKDKLENWPGLANSSEENPSYSFSGGSAEAGNKNPASPAKYYFKYLGTLHCQKEKILGGLQPFLTGQSYEVDPQCLGQAPPQASGVPGSTLPPPVQGPGCFVFATGASDPKGRASTPWTNDPNGQANVLAAISQVLRSSVWENLTCKDGPISLYRVPVNYGGGWAASAERQIFLYNGGVGDSGSAIYTLAHETGHIVDTWNPLYSRFMSEGIIAKEGYLRTYPNSQSEHEDFAETAGLYIGWKFYNPPKWGGVNYPQDYPLHYNFAKEVFFGGLQY